MPSANRRGIPAAVTGGFAQAGGETYCAIDDYDLLPPFLMTVVSASDHWMYVSSAGGLTMGRVSAERCLFPYVTADQLHVAQAHTGPLTLVRLAGDDAADSLWRPFRDDFAAEPPGRRRLLKHVCGDELVFEEFHDAWGLALRASWRTSEPYGFWRKMTLENVGGREIAVELVDGLRNICPAGAPLGLLQGASCLVDAYRHNELDAATGMGVYSLTAKIVDRAEAVEALQASVACCYGLPDCVPFLSLEGVRRFARGGVPAGETSHHGRRGNYLAFARLRLGAGETRSWHLAADVARNHAQVADLRRQLLEKVSLDAQLEASANEGRQELLRNASAADGLQATGSPTAVAHHHANVLFNNMRGGVPADGYAVETRDFRQFLQRRNRRAWAAEEAFLRQLPEKIAYPELLRRAASRSNPDVIRLSMEYLPLTFSRRHGDPSRPWNAFEIRRRREDGSTIYHYQGNWRDIFQNWEALGASFPCFLPGMVAKFVNASTIDGFNPYRIASDGIDWETPDPENPWSNIGYWGDHQIVYLTKLLEACRQHFPGELEHFCDAPLFCYANVPYRLRAYADLVRNCRDTIVFDKHAAREIDRRVQEIGSDGKLATDGRDGVYYVNLAEKLLVGVMAKLSNLVVDGGIWMNTQRPEWNDANNALVGPGLSVVTVGYLRRHLQVLIELLQGMGERRFEASVEVEQWFRGLRAVLMENRPLLREAETSPADRRRLLDAAGKIYSDYRLKVYEDGFSGKHAVSSSELADFFRVAQEYLDHTLRANRRGDGLFHAYNLLEFSPDASALAVARLDEMLEGQVSALGSRLLDGGQALEVADALFASRLYRQDQRSFLLYPQRRLPDFLERNRIPPAGFARCPLLGALLQAGDASLVLRDAEGRLRFRDDIARQADLEARLEELAAQPRWADLVARCRQQVLDVYEETFAHKVYTGRSGTMYGYEGLGCVYWHMVSKLLLALQENVFHACDQHAPRATLEGLVEAYFRVRSGLSADKTPAEYGAFPTDPYSHTPPHGGAQQPGMTGQVKEEILCRRGELGVRVSQGVVRFEPTLLRRREFLESADELRFYDLQGRLQRLPLDAGALGFTLCQTPVVYRLADASWRVRTTDREGRVRDFAEPSLDLPTSRGLFERSGAVVRVDVRIPAAQIVRA